MKRQMAMFLCIVMCVSTVMFPITAADVRDISVEENYAAALKQLGLFKGVSDTDFDLDRAPTRIEALVMLIRVLGKEQEALNGTWRHPFDDVPTWANGYVGYAYVNGLTNGISSTKFGNGDATSEIYLTFVLRALGYSDADGKDFTWNNPFSLAKNIGILSDRVDIDNFWRADVVTVSYLALSVNLKESPDTLADKLIFAGVFSVEQYGAALSLKPSDWTTSAANGEKLTAEQISEKCAPAVFYVEVYAYNGELAGTGSGFFISEDGYAITNFHVAANSSYMVITTVDGEKYDNVTVIDADKKNDLVLLKIESDAIFPYLEIGDSNAVKQGQITYAIGSPFGLENTLSQGLISNVQRTIGEETYIQVSVQIDSGSSGGALINEYGQVVAVTTAVVNGNTADLNFAVPINRIKYLDKNNTEEILLWADKFYPGLEGVYDFGAFTGIDALVLEILPLGYNIEYDATDIVPSDKDLTPLNTCLENYKKALESNGFAVTSIDGNTICYETGAVTITLKLDDDVIAILTEYKLYYYETHPTLPDFGWYSGLEAVSCNYINETYCYLYKYDDNYDYHTMGNMLFVYFALLEAEGYTFIEEGIEEGYAWYSFQGHGDEVNCFLTEEYVDIEISKATSEVPVSSSAYEKLKQYLIENGRYDAQYNYYDMELRLNGALYDITYFPESSIHLSSSLSTADKYIGCYVYIHENGPSSVVYMYRTSQMDVTYKAKFESETFSSDSTLTPYSFISSDADEKTVHDMAVAQMVETLKGCETHILKGIGITLADLGFAQLN